MAGLDRCAFSVLLRTVSTMEYILQLGFMSSVHDGGIVLHGAQEGAS